MNSEEEKVNNDNVWRVDDLDGGLISGLSNLQGLGNGVMLDGNNAAAYDMTKVLELQLFKDGEGLDATDPLRSLNHSLQESITNATSSLHSNSNTSTQNSFIDISQLADFSNQSFLVREANICNNRKSENMNGQSELGFVITMKAPTAPGRKFDEETQTWLNQSFPYEIVLSCTQPEKFNDGTALKGVISIGFHQRQHQYFEQEKYDEWNIQKPNEKMIELDVPMCFGIHNIKYSGSYSNEIEFYFNPKMESKLFIKVNCLSSDFMKTRGGASGIPLRLQLEIADENTNNGEPFSLICGCQIKVFKARGATRKLKLERERNLNKEDGDQIRPSCDVTVFQEIDPSTYMENNSYCDTPVKNENTSWSGISPTSSQLSKLDLTNNASSSLHSTPNGNFNNHVDQYQTLSANFNVEETQAWLKYNRFQNYLNCFANFTGADLLQLSRSDLIQVCGPADGIRLNNFLQARASRPLLTMYVSPEWHQSDTGMREYHAMFLEQLTVQDLKRKLAKKCNIDYSSIASILKQGPTGIHIVIDDEVVRNFIDEASHVVEVLKDPMTGLSRILLK